MGPQHGYIPRKHSSNFKQALLHALLEMADCGPRASSGTRWGRIRLHVPSRSIDHSLLFTLYLTKQTLKCFTVTQTHTDRLVCSNGALAIQAARQSYLVTAKASL